MTISRKGRRRLVVEGREYLWYVSPDTDSCFQPTLTVVSTDRRVHLRYHLVQPDDTRFVIVMGPEFRNVTCGGCWRRFRCPQFGTLETISPGDVRAFILWALTNEAPPTEVNWEGLPLPTTSSAV